MTVDAVLECTASLAELGGAVTQGVSPGGRSAGGDNNGSDNGAQLGALYAALATGCGYRYRDIDQMTLAEAGEIFRYWEANPPGPSK